MKFKLIVLVVLVGGTLSFLGVKPANLLNQGGTLWERFSGDFLAIFSGNAKNELAKEIRGNTVNKMQTSSDAVPAGMSAEMAEIVHNVNRDRKSATETVKVIDMDAEELKRRMEEQHKKIE